MENKNCTAKIRGTEKYLKPVIEVIELNEGSSIKTGFCILGDGGYIPIITSCPNDTITCETEVI